MVAWQGDHLTQWFMGAQLPVDGIEPVSPIAGAHSDDSTGCQSLGKMRLQKRCSGGLGKKVKNWNRVLCVVNHICLHKIMRSPSRVSTQDSSLLVSILNCVLARNLSAGCHYLKCRVQIGWVMNEDLTLLKTSMLVKKVGACVQRPHYKLGHSIIRLTRWLIMTLTFSEYH